MTNHAMETTVLWDTCKPAIQPSPKPDNTVFNCKQWDDIHELSELCPKCEEGFIGPDGICVICWYLG